jgi:predicted kinase
MDVIADSCNGLELTRREWEQVAADNEAEFIHIEVVCSDEAVHRRRIESRSSDIPNLRLPNWQQVEDREYHKWTKDRIVIDTAVRSIVDTQEDLMEAINGAKMNLNKLLQPRRSVAGS